MDADFLSGLILTIVVILGVGYLVAVVFGESIAAFVAARRGHVSTAVGDGRGAISAFVAAQRGSLSAMLAEQRAKPAGLNDHLIGAVGRVAGPGTNGGLRVRVGGERWSARLAGGAERTLPVGAEVVVKGVAGRVLEVEERVTLSAEG